MSDEMRDDYGMITPEDYEQKEEGLGQEMIIADERKVLDPGQVKLYEKLILVVDRNMNLDGKSKNHNSDFCIIRSKNGQNNIEPTRDFCLKAVSIFELNYEPVGEPSVIQNGNEWLVSRDVKVSLGDRFVVETGGCSTKETALSGDRAFHDALARAMTRGMKRGLEALIGLPFVNMMIKQCFGGYSRPDGGGNPSGTENRERDVSPPPASKEARANLPPKVKTLGNECNAILKKASEGGIMTVAERDSWWNKVLAATSDYNRLHQVSEQIKEMVEMRGGVV